MLFEVRFLCDRKMLAEYARKYGTGPRPKTVIICLVASAILLIYSYANGIMEDMLPFYIGYVVLASVLFFLPNWYAYSVIRNSKKQNDGVQPETVVSFGETIEMHEGFAHYSIEYRKLVRVIHLKHSYMLMLGKRNGIILNPNSFTKGSFVDFKQFLREKCPGLIIPE